MPVARSYEKYELAGEPFKESNRWYVNIQMPKGIKKVRWYSDAERAAQDRKAGVEKKNDTMDFNARHAFGFGPLGYITIYKASSQPVLERFVESHLESFRYNCTFQYYTPSRIGVPELPRGIEAIRLSWEQVQDYEDRMRPHEEITKLVNSMLGDDASDSHSVYQGEKDMWIEQDLVVTENTRNEGYYGEKHTHRMYDAKGNAYIWETGTKNFEVGMALKLKMKVKAHKEINGEQCTIVWYCKEVK